MGGSAREGNPPSHFNSTMLTSCRFTLSCHSNNTNWKYLNVILPQHKFCPSTLNAHTTHLSQYDRHFFENKHFPLTMSIYLTATPLNKFDHFISQRLQKMIYNIEFTTFTSRRHIITCLHNSREATYRMLDMGGSAREGNPPSHSDVLQFDLPVGLHFPL